MTYPRIKHFLGAKQRGMLARASRVQRGQNRVKINKKVKTLARTRLAKKSKQYYLVDDRAGSITRFNAHPKTHIPKTMYKLLKSLEPMIYNENQRALITSSVGKQEWSDITFCNTGQLQQLNSQALNAFGVVGGTGTQTNDTYIMSVHQEIRYNNMSNGLLEFDLYDWVARRDLYNDHVTNASTPKECFMQGIADQSTTASSSDYQIVGVLPFASKLFTMNYKVVKSRHIVLAPGQEHIHIINYTPKKRFNAELITNQNLLAIRGLYRGTSILFHGGIAKDGTNSNVTYTNTEVGVITSLQIKFKAIPVNWRREYIAANNLTTTLSTTAALDVLPTGIIDIFRTA